MRKKVAEYDERPSKSRSGGRVRLKKTAQIPAESTFARMVIKRAGDVLTLSRPTLFTQP
jgi:hypothetical protein